MYEHLIETLENKFPGNHYQIYWYEDEDGRERESLMINDRSFWCSWNTKLDSVTQEDSSLTYHIFLDIIIPQVENFLKQNNNQ
jgi:hypothetical protein|tara:strand:- start:8742 stop:8990 length:249 start_codon:yes stop_codon:yes gene_type:complete